METVAKIRTYLSALALATFVGLSALHITACNSAGSKAGEAANATQESSGQGTAAGEQNRPEDKIGQVTSVTGSMLPSGFDVDYSGASHAAPSFSWKTGAGENASLADYKGKVVMVNFWGTWCPPCRRELPDIVRLREKLGQEDFEVIGIAVNERPPAGVSVEQHLANFAAGNGLKYPLLVDNGDLARQYGGIRAVPTTFIINREGNVVSMLVGGKSESQFKAAIDLAL